MNAAVKKVTSRSSAAECPLVSVILPVFNEILSIEQVIAQLRATNFNLQIILVDDGSTDGTSSVLALEASQPDTEVITHAVNCGKGAAIRSGLEWAHGEIVVVQDADLEYDPDNLPALLEPLLRGEAEVVYGSRFRDHNPSTQLLHAFGNRLLTTLSNLLYGTSLTDIETGYKLMRIEAARSFDLVSDRWGFDPEITAKLLKNGYQIHEVPIRYAGRTQREGKKLSWRDGFSVLYALVKFRFTNG